MARPGRTRAAAVGLFVIGLLPMGAWATVIPTEIRLPPDIGLQMTVVAEIDWSRFSAGSGDVITVALPGQLSVDPAQLAPLGCSVAGSTVTCVVPDGNPNGTIPLPVTGVALGGFSLTATGNNPGATTATQTSSVRNSGDLIIGKTKVSPAGDAIAGGRVRFQLTPAIAAGGNDVPAGASIRVVDRLPGAAGQFSAVSVSTTGPLSPSCSVNTAAHEVVCIYSGPFNAASLGGSAIIIEGTQGLDGGFTNVAEISSQNGNYIDRDGDNNVVALPYTAQPGTDVEARGSFDPAPHVTESHQPLTITYFNNGPLPSNGGTVQTVIPAGFDFDDATWPAACTRAPGSLTVEGTPYNGTLVTCTVPGTVNVGTGQSFQLPLVMPDTPGTGQFPIVIVPPATLQDANPANNAIRLPWQVSAPFSDLGIGKSKHIAGAPGSPTSGPVAPGTLLETRLTVTNSASSSSDLTYTAARPIQLVDYLLPQEIQGGNGGTVTLTQGGGTWQCSVGPLGPGATPPSPNHTVMVTCRTIGDGTLARGNSLSLRFTTQVAAMAPTDPHVALVNRACTGGSALAVLGIDPATGGPTPADVNSDNDCQSTGSGLVATPVGAADDSGQVRIVKEVSLDGSTWTDTTLMPAATNALYWRIRITTPTTAVNAGQLTIPTLNLSDALPGIVNIDASRRTPAIPLVINATGVGSHNCPASLGAGSNSLNCSFTDVAPGAEVTIRLDVQRPLQATVAQMQAGSGGNALLENTASLSSPNAILSGTLADSATVQLEPRLDVALTSKTITPAQPAVGETVVFTLNAQNRGPFPIMTAGHFVIVDDLFTGTPTLAQPSYEILEITPSSGLMACSASPHPSQADTTRVRCQNTGTIASNTSQSVIIRARIRKPPLNDSDHPAGHTLYSGVVNRADVQLDDSLCEWRNEGTVSASCSDPASETNNAGTATFNVRVPAIDLQQLKVRVLPPGQSHFQLGDTLRYRFGVRNAGPSRAERIEMIDILEPLPSGFTFTLVSGPENYNQGTPGAGFSFVTRAVSCVQSAPNANIVCHLAANQDDSYLDAGEEVNFELALTMTGTATGPVLFGNRAYVCADETNTYESSGRCSTDPVAAANNLASVNDLIMPPADLTVGKDTVTAGPVDVGQPVQYRIALRNNGPATVAKLRMVDLLPGGFEWIFDGARAPAATAAGAATVGALGVSPGVPANGTDHVCYVSNGVTAVTAPAQRQEVTCDLGGNFPAGAANEVTVTLWARPVPGVYDGPFLADRINDVEIQPGRDADGNEVSVDGDPGNNTDDSPIQVRTAARLGGRVFLDPNDNGDQDPGDTGIPGVTVRLTGTDGNGNAVDLTATTDANGDYQFVGLPPSNAAGYTVTQAQPAGYDNGWPQPNTPRTVRNGTSTGTTPAGGSYAVSNGAAESVIGGIVLGNDADGVQFDFPEFQGVSLSGRVYEDLDRNDIYGPGDPPIANATVELLAWNPATSAYEPVATTTTQPDGSYVFAGLSPSRTYAVRQPLPAGYVNLPSAVNPGLINGAACAAPALCTPSTGGAGNPATTDQISGIVLGAGNGTEFNFGETRPVSVSGRVFFDLNNDGVQTGAESGIAGVRIVLTGTDDLGNAVTAETTTNSDGDFSFEGLRPGIYHLTEPTQPPGTANGITTAGSAGGTATPVSTTPSAISTIDLRTPGSASVDNLFGEIPLNGSISGRVWLDLDNDGVIDPSERGIAGVTIRLIGTDAAGNPVTLETTTDADGHYLFTDLSPGTYSVIEPTQPPNTRNGITVPGSLGGEATSPDVTPSAIRSIVLGPDQSSVNNNFGEIPDLVDLVVSKAATEATFQVGARAGYAIRVRNAGQRETLGQYVVEDHLPVGVVLAATPAGNGWTCTGAAGADRFSCTSDAVLAPGAIHAGVIELAVDVLPAAAAANPLNNAVLVEGGGEGPPTRPTPEERDAFENAPGNLPVCDPAITQNACRVPNQVLRTYPDMVVSKAADAEVFVVGESTSYRIRVRNAGEGASVGEYVVRDNLPEGLALAGTPQGEGWTCVGAAGAGEFRCTSDVVLAPGAIHPGAIVVPVDILQAAAEAETVDNAVIVAGGGENPPREPTPDEEEAFTHKPGDLPVCDPAVTQNACRVPNRVIRTYPDMVVSKSADTPVFTVGTQASYLIRVRNIGERASSGEYVVEDRLPAGITLAGTPSGSDWTCTGDAGGSSFRCASSVVLPAGELHPGTIRVPVDVQPEALGDGPVNNAVLVSGGGEGPPKEPTPDERETFVERPGELPECDPAVSQNVCRVPNEVQPPQEQTLLNISKRADRSVVEIGDILTYTIEIRHAAGPALNRVDVLDRLPHGFTYVDGTSRVGGAGIADPQGKPGPALVFDVGPLPVGAQKTLTYRVRVGVGAAQGDGINRAQAFGCWSSGGCVDTGSHAPRPGASPSNRTEYRVIVRGGVFADEGCVLGKVFVDCNNNHVQDAEEIGIPGVRMYFSDGTWLVSDSEGKYSYCGLPPRSHTLKVDPATLPVGSRLTTSSNRNLGDAESLFIDLKNGELHRADFIEGSCSNPVIEQVKARRTQGEVRAPETEPGQQPLRFESKPPRAPQQATDSARQLPIVDPRPTGTEAEGSGEAQP